MPIPSKPSHRAILGSLGGLILAFQKHSREVQQRIGLSAAELYVLQHLQGLPPVPLRVLAEHTLADAAALSQIVKSLAAKGMVELRSSEKGDRLLEVWIRAEGKLKLRQCPDSLQARFVHALGSLGGSKTRSLASGLDGLLRSAGIAGGPAAMFFDQDQP